MKSKIHVFSRIFTKFTELAKVNLLLFVLFAVFAVPSAWANSGSLRGRIVEADGGNLRVKDPSSPFGYSGDFSFNEGDRVTLFVASGSTGAPGELQGLDIKYKPKDYGGDSLSVKYDAFLSNGEDIDSVVFTMPSNNVVVTPIYYTKSVGRFYNMPHSGTMTLKIPSTLTSFKVYDDGGSSGIYSRNSTSGRPDPSYLDLIAPDGYAFRVTGSYDLSTMDVFSILPGNELNASNSISNSHGSGTMDVSCNNTRMTMQLNAYSGGSSGLNLTVTLVPLTYSITVENPSNGNGSIISNVSSAATGSTVTLTAKPNSGYVLKSVSVTNVATNAAVATSGGWETNNEVTFTMPAGNVKVKPTFVTNSYSVIRENANENSISGVTTATVGSTVTLTANPSSGYLFNSVSVTDVNGNPVSVSGGKGFLDRTFSFVMPIGGVTVTPVWTNNVWTAADGLYTNMPATGTVNVTIPDGVKSFKVYDDGGNSGNYSNNCYGILVLKVPANLALELSGSISTYNASDYLNVYNGSSTSSSLLLNQATSLDSKVYSGGQYMTLKFHSDGSGTYSGLNLTVNVLSKHSVTVDNPTNGGSVVSNKATAYLGTTIELTASVQNGYWLKNLSVKDADGNDVSVNTDYNTWYSGNSSQSITFTMPNSNVTVKPTFSNDWTAAEGLYVNMPATGSLPITLSSAVKSFKIYDDGGKDGKYSNNCGGTLALTAPDGYVFQLEGTINTYDSDDNLWALDVTASKSSQGPVYILSNARSISGKIYSSGNEMQIYFHSGNSGVASGLNLTVSIVPANNSIVKEDFAGGVVFAPSSSNPGKTVNVAVVMDYGYLLKSLKVVDGEGNQVDVNLSYNWFSSQSATASFTMPASDVRIIQTYTKSGTVDDGFRIDMDKVNETALQIPKGITSFKFYSGYNIGKSGNPYVTDELTITPPAGYRFHVNGSIAVSAKYDACGAGTGCNTINDNDRIEISGDGETYYYTSSSNNNASLNKDFTSMKVYIRTNGDDAGVANGAVLTVTLVPYEYTVSITSNPYGGVILFDTTVKPDSVAYLTAMPQNNYDVMLREISVKDASNNPVKVTQYSFYAASFTMPPSDVTVTSDFTGDLTAAGGLHLDMKHGTTEVEIPSKIKSFKIYDNGGEDGNYESWSNDTLKLKAPEGYRIKLTGSIETNAGYDYLYIYDGNNTGAANLYSGSGSVANIAASKTIASTDRNMTLRFMSDYSTQKSGLDLTATLEKVNYTITMKSASSGTGTLSVDGGKTADTLGAEIYMLGTSILSNVSVVDKDNKPVKVTAYTFDRARFTMPASNVTVTPSFATELTAEGGLHLDMQKNIKRSLDIPSDVRSFKIYDNGGANGDYEKNSRDTLILTAPEGFYLQVTGTIRTDAGNDWLYIFDGASTSATQKFSGFSKTSDVLLDIGTIKSSGRSLTFYFKSNSSNEYAGLDLTVSVMPVEYEIAVADPDNGRVESNKAKAAKDSLVTLQWEGKTGYILRDVDVEDASNNKIAVNGGWYSQFVTFTMPNSNVTVTPNFTNNWTAEGDDGLYINMPKTGTVYAEIPAKVKSFKVYDDGGANGTYSDNSDGSIVFKAPTGYLLKITGKVIAERRRDILYVYDGDAVNENNLLVTVSGRALGDVTDYYATNIPTTVISSGESMTIRFYSDAAYNYAGLDLTIELVKSMANMTVADIASQTYTGSAICPDVVVTDGQKTLVKNTDYTVACSNNVNAGTATVTIAGRSDYAGEVEKTFEIAPKSIADPSIEFIYEKNWTYNAELIRPSVVVKDGEKVLRSGYDYRLPATFYRHGTLYVGEFTFPIEGLGNYTGEKKLPYNVAPREISIEWDEQASFTYNGEEQLPAATIVGLMGDDRCDAHVSGKIVFDDQWEWMEAIDVGNYVATVDFLTDANCNGNYKLPETGLEKSFSIVPKSIEGLEFIYEKNWTYTGSAVKPSVVVKNGERNLMSGFDYTITYDPSVNAGAKKIGIEGKFNYTGKVEAPYTIAPKEISIAWGEQTSFEYNGKAQAPTATAVGLIGNDQCKVSVLAGKYIYDEWVDAINVGEYTAKAYALSNDNYKLPATGIEMKFSIVPKETDFAAVQVLKDQKGTRAIINADYSGKEPLSIPDPIVVDSVEVNRELTPLTPATTVLPFTLPEGTTFNARFYYVKEVVQKGCSWNATMKYIGTGKLPEANTPYAIILNKGESNLKFNMHGKQATVQTGEIADKTDATGKWLFKGLYSYKVWDDDDKELGLAYAFAGSNDDGVAKGEFGRIVAGAYAVPMRSYLRKTGAEVRLNCPAAARAWGAGLNNAVSANANADVINVNFVEDDENGEEKTTAVGHLNSVTGEFKIDRWYDLKGRPVNNVNRATKGAYYGKKVLKK